MRQCLNTICLILIVIISACGKEDYNHNPLLLYQVKADTAKLSEFTYNESNQIVEEKTKYSYFKHNYQNGRLISSDYYVNMDIYSSNDSIVDAAMKRTEWVNPSNTEKESTITYTYDNKGKLIKSEYYFICEYSYDQRNRIIRQTFYRENEETSYVDDFIYDKNDNVIEKNQYRLYYGEPEHLTTFVYEFDNKQNPYQTFKSLGSPGEYTNTNNIIKQTYTMHFIGDDEDIDKVQITENSYIYNSEGFPISANDRWTYIYY